MLTVTSKLQYDQARKERNLLAFEQVLNANKLERITQQISSFEADAEAAGVTDDVLQDDPDYQALVAEQTAYDTRNDNIATQMTLLEQDMDSFLSMEKEGIQDSTSFWCFGG